MSSPCELAGHCRNSPGLAQPMLVACAMCRLSPENLGRDMNQYWQPIEFGMKHPLLVEEKAKRKLQKRFDKLTAKRGRDANKRKVSRLAQQAEKTTEKKIIQATKNSGRQNKDGDHVSLGMITLDTKLQTTRENPVIFLHELEKAREDATRAGTLVGGLVIRNKHNIGCVVLKEEDYAELTRRLLYPEERTNESKVGS